MSDLITNLNSILSTKLEIKDILKTDSDEFAQYPSLIEAAIAEGGGTSGYTYITENGNYLVAAYAYASVDVPPEIIIPDGYCYVFGGKEITANANNIDTTYYSYVDVHVPIPAGYLLPTGTKNITENGTFDVKTYETAYIDIPSQVSGYAYITTNGDHNIAAYEMVNVAVPIPAGYILPEGTYNISENGTFNVNAYENAYVYVPTSVIEVIPPGYAYIEPETQTMEEYNITKQYDEDEGTYFLVLPTDYDGTYYSGVRLNDGYDYVNSYSITVNGEYSVSPFDFECPNEPGSIGYMRTNITVAVPSSIPAGYAYVDSGYIRANIGDNPFTVYTDGDDHYISIPTANNGTCYSYIHLYDTSVNTYTIHDNGNYLINPLLLGENAGECGYMQTRVEVAVPVPSGYIVPEGTLEISVSHSQTGIDVANYAYVDVDVPDEMFVISYDPQIIMTYLDSVVSSDVDSDGNIYIKLQDIIDEDTGTFAVNPYVTDNESQKGQWSYQISQNGDYEIDVRETGYFVNPIHVAVTPSVSGTYYATENGTYDISAYEYVDVQVSGGGQESYTWSGLTANGNPGIIISNDVAVQNGGSNLAVQVTTGSGWMSHTDYYQIISNRQFCYQLPTWVTGHKWTDYATNSYILDSFGGTTYAWDPTTWDNLTDATQADTSASKQNSYSYVITNPDVFYLQTSNASMVYPWGGNVQYQKKITEFKINADSEWDNYTIASIPVMEVDSSNGTSYIAETSYFEGQTDVRNLAGRSWKIAVAEYQNRWSLMDIVGPVAGSEVYLNEIDSIWANWNNGWNGSTYTASYNSSTSCIEMSYQTNVILPSAQTSFNIYQLEYKIDNDGSSHRIRFTADSIPAASTSNLSGVTYLTACAKNQSGGNPEDTVLFIDSDIYESTTYTNYDIDMKLCIPHDMWHYGSANHNKMWVEWTITPDDTPMTAPTVTGLRNFIGTSWTSSGSRTTGNSDGDGHYVVTVSKGNKTYAQLTTYKDFEFRVTSSLGSYTDYVPVLATPIAVDSSNLTGSQTISFVPKTDNNGVQLLNLDTSDIETYLGKSSGTAVWTITINEDDFFDSTSANYLKGTLEWTIS